MSGVATTLVRDNSWPIVIAKVITEHSPKVKLVEMDMFYAQPTETDNEWVNNFT